MRLPDSYQHLAKAEIELDPGISILPSLLTALARLKADDYRRMRQLYIRLPRAGPTSVPAGERECAQCCLCPQHGGLAA